MTATSSPSPEGRGGQGVRTTSPGSPEISRLSFNQITAERAGLKEVVDACARHGVPSVAVWRHKLAEVGVKTAVCLLRDAGVRVSSVCRGGMFPAAADDERAARIEENRRAVDEAAALGAEVLVLVCGAGTDQLAPADGLTLADVERAYTEQVGYVEGLGGRVVLMASRALARAARGPDDYARVYGTVLRQVSRPVILHWLGDMFDPQLAGYWGTRDVDQAMDACVAIICEHRAKIDGIKISLLDAEREVAMRRQLPGGVRMYTGDDFNYERLILGDERGHSDALLGIFDAIAPAASAALQALDRGDVPAYRAALAPTVPLARHIFQGPTHAYKTGIVFLAYLNGHQPHFRMIGGAESWRSVPHLAELFRLADAAGLLVDPDGAMDRMRPVLALAGVE